MMCCKKESKDHSSKEPQITETAGSSFSFLDIFLTLNSNGHPFSLGHCMVYSSIFSF